MSAETRRTPGGAHPNWRRARPWLDQLLKAPPDTDQCIVWPFTVVGDVGYPAITIGGATRRVGRLVLTHFNGEPEPGQVAAHKPIVCHNVRCVNPRHLRWATVVENMQDRVSDGTDPRGERNPQAKLRTEQVLDIYHSHDPDGLAAERHGVSRSAVEHIRAGRSWAWLTQGEAAS